jgi:glycosyltransferase involved in cell wall biosynthesis
MNIAELTYVTTCKGRLDHLKQSLPRVVAQGIGNIIVVDFDCPDGTAQWVKETFPTVQVIKIENQAKFLHAHTRNLGGNAAKTRWIAFFDADAMVDEHFFEKVAETIQPGFFYIPDNPDGNTWGSCFVEKSNFDRVGGFDEAVDHWGGVDMAFYNLLGFVGVPIAKYDGSLISAIKHDDQHRMKFTAEQDVEFALQMSVIYEQCKLDAMRIAGGIMPLEVRRTLRQAVRTALKNARDRNGKPRSFTFELPPAIAVRPRLGEKGTPVVNRSVTFEVSFRN